MNELPTLDLRRFAGPDRAAFLAELRRTAREIGFFYVTGHDVPDDLPGAVLDAARRFFALSAFAAPHDYMMGTGGSIGGGIPMATGAAIACPGRKVINLEADGSGMYTVQGLWTQARENLDVVTIVFSNRTYAILHGEMRNVGVGAIGENARRMLDLDHPSLDWVSLAKGMGVEAARADTCERFDALLDSALSRRGPFLIEAVL